jgi:hypothetical protein
MILHTVISNLAVLVGSTVKFSLATSAVIAANMGIPGTISNLIGGIIGIVTFVYIDDFAQQWLIKKFPNKFNKKFSRRTRFLARVKQIFGLWGIAFLTPIVLSIPVGVFFAMDLTTNKRKVITQMIVACVSWSIVLYAPYYIFHINVVEWVKGMF